MRSDMFTKEERSEIMSRIRSRDTRAELLLKELLERIGARFEYHPKLFGNPDFLLDRDIVVFIDNMFWHGRGNLPKSNRAYWRNKLERNRRRDLDVNRELSKEGFTVIRIEDLVVLRLLKNLERPSAIRVKRTCSTRPKK